MDIIDIVLSKKYTNESLKGITGTLAGKNCTIKSATKADGVTTVVFAWTANDGTEKTTTIQVNDGNNDYEDLINIPKVEGVDLIGNKTFEDLGVASATDLAQTDGYLQDLADLVGDKVNLPMPNETVVGNIKYADTKVDSLKEDYEQLVNKQTSLNLLDESAMIENQTIYLSGETGQGQGSWLTPSMEVGGLNKLTIHVLSGTTTPFRYCFYTEDNTPLGAVMGLNANGNATVDVPSTAKYFRFTLPNNLYTNAKANGMMVQSGDTFTKYEPYGAYIASMVYPSSEVIAARGTYANLNDRLNSIPSGGGGEVNNWKGKVVAFLGDSITWGYGSNDNPYWKQLASKYEFTAHGYGVNGADSNGLYSQAQTMFAELGQTVDAVFILCGTNNFKAGGAVGDSFYTESDNTRTIRITGTNFKGSLNQLINYLKKNLPTKQIIIMTPLHRGYFHNSAETQPTELQKNSGGFWFDEYVNAVREASKVWSIPCIDLNSDCGLYPMLPEHAQLYFVDATNDQLHPNELGHSRIADCIGEKLKTIFV